MAGEHVAVKSNGKGKQADDQGEELEEPDDRNHRLRKARRSDGLDVAPAALGLDAVEVEVQEREQCKCERDGQGAGRRLRARDKADHVGDEDEEKHGRDERDVLLVAMADSALTHVAANCVVTPLHKARELALGDDLDLVHAHEHAHEHDRADDDHPKGVLGDSDAIAEIEDERRVERLAELLNRSGDIVQGIAR